MTQHDENQGQRAYNMVDYEIHRICYKVQGTGLLKYSSMYLRTLEHALYSLCNDTLNCRRHISVCSQETES